MLSIPDFKFATSEKIYWAFRKQEAIGIVSYGEWGAGKSSFAIQVLKELYPGEEWKKYLVFKPEDFLNLVDGVVSRGERVPCVVWDDAGLWLYALDWNDPRVKSVVKFLNVLRTVMGGLIMTTPAIDMIVTKIPHIEGMRIAKTTRVGGANKDMRLLQAYRNTFMPWGKRYVKVDWQDPFNVMLSREDYGWYSPIRNHYAKEAIELMRSAWKLPKYKENIDTKEAQIAPIAAQIDHMQQNKSLGATV